MSESDLPRDPPQNPSDAVDAPSEAVSASFDPPAPAAAPPPPHQYFTKGRSKAQASPLDPETLSSARQAAALLAERCPGLAGLLQQPQSAAAAFLLELPPEAADRAVAQAAARALQEAPPWVHWNRHDAAAPLRADPATRLQLTAAQYRGYRMARATHGARGAGGGSTGPPALLYFECVVGPFPTAREISANLPPHARLGGKLQAQLRAALAQEQEQQRQQQQQQQQQQEEAGKERESEELPPDAKKRKLDYCRIGGHVRLGFSRRTGDLQAPVGYDKWSYAITSAGGIVHASKRQEDWNQLYATEGDTENKLHPGDVVGCAILLDGQNNHIRFFQNGQALGNFVIAKGKRLGGEAYENVEMGAYYPAASIYLGGSVRANFGPHWICPPRKLPQHLKKILEPFSSLCLPPSSPEQALQASHMVVELFERKPHQEALKRAIMLEAQMRFKAYEEFSNNHLEWIRQEREERGWSVVDLPEPSVAKGESGSSADSAK